MNSSKLEAPKKEPEKKAARQRKKNIREIYLKAVNNNRNSRGGLNRTRSISNIQNIEPGSSAGSHYLESEYNLVKKIISATKALQKLKTNPESAGLPTGQASSCHGLGASNGGQATTLDAQCRPQPAFRSVEEYCGENLALKKKLLVMQNQETIMKAKMDYYEKELAKKDQEIMDLLDVKKNEESRTNGESKSDLSTLVYTLKLKAYKLELALRSKERELRKLSTNLKMSSIKELTLQNEKLKSELSKALMNDSKILEGREINSLFTLDNKSVHAIESNRSVVESISGKNDTVRQNLAKIYLKHLENDPEYRNKAIYQKLHLKGSLKEKLEQLDNRETELLHIIGQLNKEVDLMKSTAPGSSRPGSGRRSRDHVHEKEQLKAVRVIQTVMKGHLERSGSLKRDERNRERNQQREDEHLRRKEDEVLQNRRARERPRSAEDDSPRSPSPPPPRSPRRRPSLSPPRPHRRGGRDRSPSDSPQRSRYNLRENSYSDDDDDDDAYKQRRRADERRLIPDQKNPETTDVSSCCSPWRNRKPSKEK